MVPTEAQSTFQKLQRPLKKTVWPSPRSNRQLIALSTQAWAPVECWVDHVHVSRRQPQLMSMGSSPDMSRRHCFSPVLPNLYFLQYPLPTSTVVPPCALVRGGTDVQLWLKTGWAAATSFLVTHPPNTSLWSPIWKLPELGSFGFLGGFERWCNWLNHYPSEINSTTFSSSVFPAEVGVSPQSLESWLVISFPPCICLRSNHLSHH